MPRVTRRRFLEASAAAAGAIACRGAWAARPGERLALVIGNSAYKDSPLLNPRNDAEAVAKLFADAGVEASLHADATRDAMVAAIERFAEASRRPEARQLFFYYAGHGVQLDWRNYLLPVDTKVASADDIKARCVDLGMLLGPLQQARGKTVIVILDACRNDPFGTAFRPTQRGLSQFDAPAGSLLAYSTSPGSVASDGDGKHGLYTEHLVRELSVRSARIEDALKRVRINVRLASRGAQVPWETTSLESDVYVFEDGRKALSEAELEKQLEEDIAAWTAIRASRSADDWIAYLRKFPNGRFAEIAQMRVARLLPAAAMAVNAGALPIVRTQDDYDALPKGAVYVDPNGVQRRKSP